MAGNANSGRRKYNLDERIIGVEICERVQELRVNHGMSKGELARRLGVAPSTVSSWELEDKIPMLIPLVKVCEVFGVSMDWLVFGKETDNEKI